MERLLKRFPVRRTRTDVRYRDRFAKNDEIWESRTEWPLMTMCCQSYWRGDLLWNSRWVRWRRERECQPSLPKSDIAVTWHVMWQDKTVQDTTRRRIPSAPRCHAALQFIGLGLDIDHIKLQLITHASHLHLYMKSRTKLVSSSNANLKEKLSDIILVPFQ